jgi:hypothetical protein
MSSEYRNSHDSLEVLDSAIELGWVEISQHYDVSAPQPPLECLFRDADLNTSSEAAEVVVVNMLLDVIERVDRFSCWYTRSANDFGLTSIWNCETKCHQWILTMEAYIQWIDVIQTIRQAVEANLGVLQGILLVEHLMNNQAKKSSPCIIAHCQCSPPRFIKINTAALEKAKIICDACLEPFIP